MSKKVICFAMVLVMVLVAPVFALASGVPVFQKYQTIYSSANNVSINYYTSYDFRSSSYDESWYGTAGKYVLYSPSYVGTNFWITSWTGNAVSSCSQSESSHSLLVEGFDGTNWIAITSGGNSTNTSYSLTVNNESITPVKQIRIAAIIGYRNPDKISGSGSASITQFGISILGADQDSVNESRDAANAANMAAENASLNASLALTAANNANTSASNAYNSVYNANGNTITAVRDASGTVLSEARQAKTNSQNASTYASQASTNSLNAYNTAQTVNTKIDTLSTAVTNIQNNMGADTSPPEIQIATVSGAMATSGNSIRAIIDVSDNLSTTFSYSLDGVEYQPLPSDWVVNLPVYSSGVNLITVWVMDEAGNRGRGSITIRKL